MRIATWRVFLFGFLVGLVVGLLLSDRFDFQLRRGPMPYALIAWKPPADATDAVASDIQDMLEGLGMIPFFPGFGLVDDDEPNWGGLRAEVSTIVANHPGMEAGLVIPGKGVRFGGWVEDLPTVQQLERARALMNQSGNDTYPVLREIQ